MLSVIRKWLVLWLYLLAFGHFAAGIMLAWYSGSFIFDHYHHSILSQFENLSSSALQLQVWWVSLFGATLQTIGIFMGVLIYVASQRRSGFIWACIIVGLIVWVPQDILISLQINLWLHVWVDLLAMMLILPPLIILCWIDRQSPC